MPPVERSRVELEESLRAPRVDMLAGGDLAWWGVGGSRPPRAMAKLLLRMMVELSQGFSQGLAVGS